MRNQTDTLRDAAEPVSQVTSDIGGMAAMVATDIATVGAETIVDNSEGIVKTLGGGIGNILGTVGLKGGFGFGNTFSIMGYLIVIFAVFYVFKMTSKAGDAQVDSLMYG